MIGYPLNSIKLQRFIIYIFLILSEGVFGDNFLTAARMSDSDKATRFVFEFKNNVTYKVIELVEPARLVIDFAKSDLSTNLSNLDISGTNILKIRTSKKKFGDLRLVLDLKDAMRFQHFLLNSAGSEKTRFVIDFFKAPVNEERISKTDKTPKRKILIAIDAGHGGKDPGALGPGKIQEKHIVLSISKKIERLFDQDPSFDGFLTRDGDYFLDHRKRSRLAFDKRADFFVSIHADAFPDSRANGASVYVLSTEGSESEVGKFLSEGEIRRDLNQGSTIIEIDKQEEGVDQILLDLTMDKTLEMSLEAGGVVVERLSRVARRMHKKKVERASFLVLKSPDIPSLLIETGFISNPAESRRLADESYQNKLAQAIYFGIRDFHVKNTPYGALKSKALDYELYEYELKSGDTLSQIAVDYGFKMDDLLRFNGLKSSKLVVGQNIKFPRANENKIKEIYVVKNGDTLSEIAQSWNISLAELRSQNNLSSNVIKVGQRLTIYGQVIEQPKTVYIVKRGDTLSEIALKNKTTTKAIMRSNNLSSSTISVGQKLAVP